MKRRLIISVLTIVMLVMAMVPAASFAKTIEIADEEYIEYLEYEYGTNIKDRSKYCDAVWNEIQQVYMEGRACYAVLESEDDYYAAPDYETMLYELGKLTWVKGYEDLPKVKERCLAEIQEAYSELSKSDYNDYNWDMVIDYMYVGKKQIKEADTFAETVMGYSDAFIGIDYATTKEELKDYKKSNISELAMIVNICIDPDDVGAVIWAQIQTLYKDAVAAINACQQEYEIYIVVEEYMEKICALSGLPFPMTYEAVEEALLEIMKPAVEFYEEMDEADYIWERIEEAEFILWDLEEDLYEITNRSQAEGLVNAALEKMKALPKRSYDENLVATYVAKVKATGNTGTSIKVTWNANKDLNGYVLYRATAKNGEYKKIKTFWSGKRTSYIDNNLTFGKTYYYKIKAMKDIDWETKYTKISAPAAGTPKLMAPAVKLSKSGTADVLLKWNKVPGAKGYQIWRSNSVNGQFTKVKTVTKGSTLQWKDTSTVKGKTYCYKMRTYTIKADGTKKWSAYSTIKTIKR